MKYWLLYGSGPEPEFRVFSARARAEDGYNFRGPGARLFSSREAALREARAACAEARARGFRGRVVVFD